jgi:RNase H-like protein
VGDKLSLQNLIFDVETIGDYARSDLWLSRKERPADVDPDEWLNEQTKLMALQPEACQLVGLNVILGDGEAKSGWVGEENKATGQPYSESDLLNLFWTWAAQCPRLIGFNCLRFDLPVIYTRSALLGVRPTVELFDVKPWQDRVIDLAQRRFGHSRDWMSLKALRRVLQLPVPGKYESVLENTGTDVENLYLAFLSGDAEALKTLKLYGELDVYTTRALAQLWSGLFFGKIE